MGPLAASCRALGAAVNQNNDTTMVTRSVEKLFNKGNVATQRINTSDGVLKSLEAFVGSEGRPLADLYTRRAEVRAQRTMLASGDQQVLAPEQSVRQFASQADALTRFNFPTTDLTAQTEVDYVLNATRTA